MSIDRHCLRQLGGFRFERIAPGPDGPLRGIRKTLEFRDEVYVAGFWEPESCTAIRRRRSSLVVPGGMPVAQRVTGDAITEAYAKPLENMIKN
jgi:hypothetical protein